MTGDLGLRDQEWLYPVMKDGLITFVKCRRIFGLNPERKLKNIKFCGRFPDIKEVAVCRKGG